MSAQSLFSNGWFGQEPIRKGPVGAGTPILCRECEKPAATCEHAQKQRSACRHCTDRCFCTEEWAKREMKMRSELSNVEFTVNAIAVFEQILQEKVSQEAEGPIGQLVSKGSDLLKRRELLIKISDKGVLTEKMLMSLDGDFEEWEREAALQLESLFCR